MNKHQRRIIDLILNDPEFLNHLKEESERTKKRIAERNKKQQIVPYIRVGNEKQLEKLDSLYAHGYIDDEEYVKIRMRLSGVRNV